MADKNDKKSTFRERIDKTEAELKKSREKSNKGNNDQLGTLEKMNKALGEYNKGIQEKLEGIKELGRNIKDLVKTMSGYQAALVAVTVASKVLTPVGNALSSIFDKLWKSTKFIVKHMTMMPIVIGNFAASMGNSVRTEIIEAIGGATEGLKEFFDTASNGGGAVTNLGKIATGALGSFQSVNSQLTKLFGFGAQGAASMIQQLGQGINSMGVFAELFAESTTASVSSIVYFQKMTKGLGMSAEDTKYITLEAAKNGEHYFDTMLRVKDASDSASKQFGVNRKRLSMGFFDLRKDIVNFGHLSEPALMAVVGKATQLGVSMESLKGVFSKFNTFESAAQSAAMLQQTFGMNIDALQLIRAENPMEIVEMFRQSMLATGRSFDDLNRHEKNLMAQHTGMSAETLKAVMNYRTLGKSFEEIKKIMNDQKPEERHIRAMKDMNSSVTEMKKTIEGKGFFQNFFDGVTTTIKYNTKLGKSFVAVSQRMEDFYEHGLSLTKGQKKMLNQALSPFTNIINEIIGKNGPFSKNAFKKFKNTALKNLSEFVGDVFGFNKGKPKMALRDAQKKWTNKLTTMFSFENLMNDQSFLGKIYRSSGRIIGVIVRGLAAALPAITIALGNLLNGGLANIDNFFNSQSDMGQKVMKWLGFSEKEGGEIFASITEGLRDMKNVFIGDGKQKGLLTRIFENVESIFKNAGKMVLQGLLDNKDMLREVIQFVSFGIYDTIVSLLMSNKATSVLFTDKAGSEAGYLQAQQAMKDLGARKALESSKKSIENFDLDKLGNDVNQAREITRLISVQVAANAKAQEEINNLKLLEAKEIRKRTGTFTLKDQEALDKKYSRDMSQGPNFNQEAMLRIADKENFFKGGGTLFKTDMANIFGKSFITALTKEGGKSYNKEIAGAFSSSSTESDRYNAFKLLLEESRKQVEGNLQYANTMKIAEEARSNSLAKKEKEEREALELQRKNLLAVYETLAAAAEKNVDATRKTTYNVSGFKEAIDFGKDSGIKYNIAGRGSDEAKNFDKTNLVEADKGLIGHDVLGKIANLVGKKGDDAKLTRQDLDYLYTANTEATQQLLSEFKQYLDGHGGQSVIVTVDGYEFAAYTDTVSRNRALNPANAKAKPVPAVGKSPSTL